MFEEISDGKQTFGHIFLVFLISLFSVSFSHVLFGFMSFVSILCISLYIKKIKI